MTTLFERREHVATITISRPDRRNALDQETLEELAAALQSVGNGSARALVLTGSDGHFCAGADLGGVEDEGFTTALRAVLDALHDAPCPTIAAIEGVALGAGLQLAIACDLRIATADAKLGIPAGRLGLCVDHWTVQRLVAVAGDGPARSMLLAAAVLSGDDAHRLGLVQRLGPLAAAQGWAAEIAALAPLTLQAHKLMLNRPLPAAGADPEVAQASRRAWGSEDLQEGLAAFRDRRSPSFQGR